MLDRLVLSRPVLSRPVLSRPVLSRPVMGAAAGKRDRRIVGDNAIGFPVWGTTALLMVTDPRHLERAGRVLDAELAAMGDACDRFRADSELSRLNARSGRPVRVSPLFAETLGQALRVAEATDGAVDPTVGGALIAAGYDRDLAEVRSRPANEPLDAAPVGVAPIDVGAISVRSAGGWRGVRLDGDVVRTQAGVVLDLGATAKAFCADRTAAKAALATGCGVLVALGGDIAVAGPAPTGGWRIRAAEDHHAGPRDPGQDVTITAGGLATSSVTVRRWRRGNRLLHHIIDPATGMPAASCWRTAGVAAATCVDANAAATAAIVMGRAAGAWLARQRLPARLVGVDGSARTIAGWPAAPAIAEVADGAATGRADETAPPATPAGSRHDGNGHDGNGHDGNGHDGSRT